MKWSNFGLLFWFLVFFVSSITFSKTQADELYSLSAESGHVSIGNNTDRDVTFYLESENTTRSEHRLSAKTTMTFTGSEDDSWFRIYVYSQNDFVEYKLDAGERYYLDWNRDSILDVFEMPPR